MMPLDVKKLEKAAKDVVFKAKREERLEEVTIKSVRRQVEQELGLEEGACDEYRKEMKVAVNWALENDEPAPLPSPSKHTKKPSKDLKRKAVTEDDEPVKKMKAGVGGMKSVKRGTRVARVDSESEEESPELGEASMPSPKKPVSKAQEQKPYASPQRVQSDTELSSVYDEPPTKRRSKPKADVGERKPKRARKESDHPASSTEEEVGRLKKFVTACGVRKVWSKELAGLAPPEQVRHLRRLLGELGMTGRLSLEKAKKVRERRELAQEIEDVVEYERERGMSGGRTTRKSAEEARRKVRLPSESEGEPEEDQEEVVARQKREKDLLAFIGDQSDGE
ncbi:hypothetical protein CALVIDRAFT_13042 [Calocera viscosa TUFC12733]|uniref:DEK C-terminal domain-containing protein n=1 Tax=Calocera viscosa (strain TUFC12733) TaxID=1330018 RepID=A0A167S6N8_CALVF|nr:hypothetical protein CALVIDRAFT_13042 [Calocera viscosa TUFC12733]